MTVDSTRNDTTVRVRLPDHQLELLDALAAEDGPYDDRSAALAAVIEEFEGLSRTEPVARDRPVSR
jgi:hypothetical protein